MTYLLKSALLLLALCPLTLKGQSIWNTTTGNWSAPASWTGSVLPVSSETLHLRFNATSVYTSTNDLGSFTLNRLTVNNTSSGILTLAAATGNTLNFAGAAPTLDITGTLRYTGLMTGAATITKIGTGTFIHDSNNSGFTGTIIINEGTFANWAGTSSTNGTTSNFNPTAIIVNNGGTYQFGNLGYGDPNLPNTTYITVNEGGQVQWEETQTFGGFQLAGGTLNLTLGNATANGTSPQIWTHGTLTGNAYTGTAYNVGGSNAVNKTTDGTLTLNGAVSINSTGGFRIQEGTVVMAHAANLGTAPLTFGADGTSGTLIYQGASASRAGTIMLATGGTGTLEVSNASSILTLSGNLSGSGFLQKTGPGALHLTGALNATGVIQVTSGLLRVNPVNAASPFFVEPGAVLAVNSGSSNESFSLPMLYLGENSRLDLELSRANLPSQALVNVRNDDSFFFGDGATLYLSNTQNFANGIYTLINYSGMPISEGLNLKLAGRTLGNLIYNVNSTAIQVEITGTDTLVWTGATNNVWDVGTKAGTGGTFNWKLASGGTATNYIDTDTLLFDDTAELRQVSLAGSVSPFAVSVNTDSTYHFSGAGKITGSTGLTMSGSGTLIMATDNDYSGVTHVSGGGTLQFGDGGTRGSIVGPLTLAGGTLAFDRSEPFVFDNTVTLSGNNRLVQDGAGTVTIHSRLALGTATFTFDGIGVVDMVGGITGSNTLIKNGSGHLNLLGDNNFNGTLIINAGIVQLNDLGASGDLDAVSIVVNNGGTFIFGGMGNPDLPSSTIVTINTGGLFETRTGESYGGFVLNGGRYHVQAEGTSIGSTGEAPSVGAVVFDLRAGEMTAQLNGSGAGAPLGQSSGGVLAKTTSGTVTVGAGVTFNNNLPVEVREGVLSMTTGSLPAAGSVTNGTGSPLAWLGLGTSETSGTLRIQGGGVATSSRAVILAAGGGRIDITDTSANVTLSGAFSGPGGLLKSGAGTLNLTGTQGATGTLRVQEGLMRLNVGTVTGGLAASSGAVLAVNAGNGQTALQAPTLTMDTGSTLLLELNTASLPVSPLVNITGMSGFSMGSTFNLLVSNVQRFASGLYTLVDYQGAAITSGISLSIEGRSTGTLVYDTAGTRIQMNLVQGEDVRWTGSTSSTWDVGTAINSGGSMNWQTATSLATTNFVQSDFVQFDDSASRFDVSLSGTLRPASLSVNASQNYLFSGSGKISGLTGLTKSGTGTLTLATDNDYTGTTLLNGGTLQLGNGGSTGSISGPLVISGGTLSFHRSEPLTMTSAITLNASTTFSQQGSGAVNLTSPLALGTQVLTVTGSGDLTLSGVISGTAAQPLVMNGTGVLYLPATNTFTGVTVINSGTVSISTSRGLGATTADVLINGGTLQLTATNLGNVVSSSRTITIGAAGATLDFWVDQGFQGSGFVGTGDVVKTGAGMWSVTSNTSTFSGNITIREGGLRMTSAQLQSAKNLTVESGGQFVIDDDVNGTWSLATGGKFTFNGDGLGQGALRQINSNADTAGNVFTTTFNRELDLNSNTLISTEVVTGTISITSNITGPGKLSKQGPGVLRLAANTNTYTGGTEILAGTLLLANTSGSATGTGPVIMHAGSHLLGTGRTNSHVTLQNGATIQGGTATAPGTLTINGDVVLQTGSTAAFRINSTSLHDRLVFNQLTVETEAVFRIILGYAPAEGQSFDLIDWTSLGTNSSTNWTAHLDLSQAILPSGLVWDTSLFSSNGTLFVAIVPEPSRSFLLAVAVAGFCVRRRRSVRAGLSGKQ